MLDLTKTCLFLFSPNPHSLCCWFPRVNWEQGTGWVVFHSPAECLAWSVQDPPPPRGKHWVHEAKWMEERKESYEEAGVAVELFPELNIDPKPWGFLHVCGFGRDLKISMHPPPPPPPPAHLPPLLSFTGISHQTRTGCVPWAVTCSCGDPTACGARWLRSRCCWCRCHGSWQEEDAPSRLSLSQSPRWPCEAGWRKTS